MQLFPIKTPLIKRKDDLVYVLIKSMKKARIKPKNGDILVVSSKVVALSEGRILNYKNVKPSEKATSLAKRYDLEPGFVELVLQEADKVFGGVKHAILTLKNNILIANAGVDRSNAPENHAILWPESPSLSANNIRKKFKKRLNVNIGVIISDSHCSPLRTGTTGFALATSGFDAVIDERGNQDLFGKKMRITQRAVADGLASAAVVIMGETDEKIPAVLIRDTPVKLTNQTSKSSTFFPPDECLFSSIYNERVKNKAVNRRLFWKVDDRQVIPSYKKPIEFFFTSIF
ncbi:MAG: coenzyme F420-0:L-glutamate ligase [Candidatus Aenigmarchaeota archaeon]|nr:coenzyme F420-0:L-glutamate ligase [Candidatus Aenigmarchaeota archaeon]